MTTGPESEEDQAKRHRQRTLFDRIAERYEQSRPRYPSRVVEFVITAAGLGPGSFDLVVSGAAVLAAGEVIGLESTRATFLSWPYVASEPATGGSGAAGA